MFFVLAPVLFTRLFWSLGSVICFCIFRHGTRTRTGEFIGISLQNTKCCYITPKPETSSRVYSYR
ncbi:hypothetical protein GQ43DRAFT_493580 [Delitschia confertaspora ATCC 74209]|uniref:Uncharacterized protein n=1 Tax=Delitschia confertaspora ATCC 74209 TaxID=1513339 RepID=A0A9P4JVE4_9PLEO|nr:hypothetical protein GQ43DRAFT_493580 [Delitschia confertaspora ATCC 74209]